MSTNPDDMAAAIDQLEDAHNDLEDMVFKWRCRVWSVEERLKRLESTPLWGIAALRFKRWALRKLERGE